MELILREAVVVQTMYRIHMRFRRMSKATNIAQDSRRPGWDSKEKPHRICLNC